MQFLPKADTSNSNSSDTKAVKVVIGASPSPHVEILEAAKSELAKKELISRSRPIMIMFSQT